MLSATDKRPDPLDNEMVMPTWLVWLQLGLSTTLAVLFVVVLVKARQQSVEIRQLEDRVAGFENSRALDRTTALEDQLRTTAERIQVLERQGAAAAALASENVRLRQDLNAAKSAAAKSGGADGLGDNLPPLPPPKP